jgi:microcin C transport system substrate-binding protein
MTRKLSLALASLVCALALSGNALSASENPVRHHALSLVGEPRHGPEYDHFDWVKVDAPKGGRVRQWAFGAFDTLNQFPDSKGRPAAGIELIYDRLMTSSPDEPATVYSNIAEWVSYPDDFSSATVKVRSIARFNDGTPVTPDDVVFSFEALKQVSGFYRSYYKNVSRAEKTGQDEVTFTFNLKGNRELPFIICELPVLPKHYWTAKGSNGETRDLSKSTLEVPLGSGPYRIKEVNAGRSITFERVKDWWGKDLPANKGQWNFDEIEFDYYLNKVAAFEDFKSGRLDYWAENSAKEWATSFNFDAITRGLVQKLEVPITRVQAMQAFVFNLRRPQFQDARVRHAFDLVLNFEWANKALFYNQYARVNSFFGNSDLQATGIPEGRELELLKTFEGKIPPEVFTEPYKNPVNATREDVRKNLENASKLLAEAGWHAKGGSLVNSAGQPLTAEFLLVQPEFERIVLPYKHVLDRLGIKATVRTVDTSQYQRRKDTFDFDIIVSSFPQSVSPGNEQRDYWGSEAAHKEGSHNLMGISNPVVDQLINRIVMSKDRADLVAATRALDRVLLWSHYVIPQWRAAFDRIAIWKAFGRPSRLPSQTVAFTRSWWYDETAAKKLNGARGG